MWLSASGDITPLRPREFRRELVDNYTEERPKSNWNETTEIHFGLGHW